MNTTLVSHHTSPHVTPGRNDLLRVAHPRGLPVLLLMLPEFCKGEDLR